MISQTPTKRLIILSEASEQLVPSPSARDIKKSTEAANLVGIATFYIPQDFSKCENAANALSHIPPQNAGTRGFWIGYIPDLERYESIYRAALEKGIELINRTEEHQTAQEFDHAYIRLGDLTPLSTTVMNIEEAQRAAAEIGYPVFLKGAIQSRKSRGWKACVAESAEELPDVAHQLFELNLRSRGRVVVRKLIRLRHQRVSPEGFPIGREYRVFLLDQKIVGLGYYWEGEDPLKDLTSVELSQVSRLAGHAARRMQVPFISVDIGQLDDLSWVVIETGDAQFSGLSQVKPLQFWANVLSAIE